VRLISNIFWEVTPYSLATHRVFRRGGEPPEPKNKPNKLPSDGSIRIFISFSDVVTASVILGSIPGAARFSEK
jgi:hypothetical protein